LTLIAGRAFAERLGAALFFPYLSQVASGEIGRKAGAEGATAPETLRQMDPRDIDISGKRHLKGFARTCPPTG
jgi:hypothetical protein